MQTTNADFDCQLIYKSSVRALSQILKGLPNMAFLILRRVYIPPQPARSHISQPSHALARHGDQVITISLRGDVMDGCLQKTPSQAFAHRKLWPGELALAPVALMNILIPLWKQMGCLAMHQLC